MTRLSMGPIPLYHQLEQDILGRIEQGEWRVGDGLPTEEQLCAMYGVSRITVRKALDVLLRNGLIVRRRGIGTFVAEPKRGVHAIHLTGSLEDFLQTANRLVPRVLSLAPAPAPADVAKLFEMPSGDEVLRLELLSSTEEGPLAHSEFFFPAQVIGRLTIEEIRSAEPIVRAIERKMGLRVMRAEQMLDAAAASADTAMLLELAPGTPLLRSRRVYFTEADEPIEIVTLRYHPERYRYEVELRARPYAV